MLANKKTFIAVLAILAIVVILMVLGLAFLIEKSGLLPENYQEVTVNHPTGADLRNCEVWVEEGEPDFHWLSCDDPMRGGPDFKIMVKTDGDVKWILPDGVYIYSSGE